MNSSGCLQQTLHTVLNTITIIIKLMNNDSKKVACTCFLNSEKINPFCTWLQWMFCVLLICYTLYCGTQQEDCYNAYNCESNTEICKEHQMRCMIHYVALLVQMLVDNHICNKGGRKIHFWFINMTSIVDDWRNCEQLNAIIKPVKLSHM